MDSRGQSITEYAILLGLVIAAVTGMQLYAKRGLQAGLKRAADSLSPIPGDTDGRRAQLEGIRFESGERRNRTAIVAGRVLENTSTITSDATREVTVEMNERQAGGLDTEIVTDTTTVTGPSSSRVVVEVR